MPVLLTILGVIAGLGFWWYRIKGAGQAAGEIIDTAQRVRGSIKRRHFRNKAGKSAFGAIDDPVIGAAALIIAMADEAEVHDPGLDAELKGALAQVSNGPAAEEAVIYGRWAVKDAAEASSAIRLICPMLNEKLSPDEREQLVAMAHHVIGQHDHNKGALQSALKTLRQRLGLLVD